MCVDLPGAASQVPERARQSDHIARRRYVSGFVMVRVRVPLTHQEPLEAHHALVAPFAIAQGILIHQCVH
jgi:hypothetical protein